MDISRKLEKFLPEFENVLKLFEGCPTEITIFTKAYQVLARDKRAERLVGFDDELKYSLLLVQALKDRMWEIINTGHYSSVSTIHRQTFTLANAFKVALILLQFGDISAPPKKLIESCIYDIDYGLLLGCPLDGENSEMLVHFLEELRKVLIPDSVDTEEFYIEPNVNEARRESNYSSIDILKCPSIDLFQNNYFSKRMPVILRNCMDQWPAIEKWTNPNYLIRMAGERTVPIEIGSHYTNDDWSQDLVKFKDFIRRHFLKDSLLPESNRVEYLAQHNLFDQVPSLKQDILVPDYCCVSETEGASVQQDIKAWLGPEGTISPMHHDPKHNLLCQVFGHKRIILAAPEDSQYLYPHKNDMLSNTSLLDAEHVDLEKFPLASKVKFYSIVLYRGEILYIPPKWWHYVRSLEKSFSVSFWWD